MTPYEKYNNLYSIQVYSIYSIQYIQLFTYGTVQYVKSQCSMKSSYFLVLPRLLLERCMPSSSNSLTH